MTPSPRRFSFLLALPLLLAGACSGGDGDAPPSADEASAPAMRRALDPEALAAHMVERLAPREGERVLLVAAPGRFAPLASALNEALAAAGAEPLGVRAVGGGGPASWATPFIDSLAERSGAALSDALREVEVGVMLPGATEDPVYAAWQEILAGDRGRALHVHWDGAYDLDGTERVIEPAVDMVYQAAILDVDREAMVAEQEAFREALRTGEVRVETPLGTDLTFRVENRPVIVQDGDASPDRARAARTLVGREIELPAGAVRVAPVEESVRGVVAFPPSLWRGERVEGLRMTFEEGRVTDVEADSGVDAVLATLEEGGPEARSLRGFALGFNPVLEVPRSAFQWIPYYGYGAGVVRLSLGGNTDLGGAVEGDWVRWNFFTDARVTVGETRWVDYGRLVDR